MKRILVPVDFSEVSANALKFAHSLAVEKGMPLSLLYCYPLEEYSRKYDFPKTEYGQGVREMLKIFYQEHISDPVGKTIFLSREGSVVDKIVQLSTDYQLILLSSRKFNTSLNRWLGTRSITIASKASCPVMIVPASAKYAAWENIWHIKRKENEDAIMESWLKKLAINPEVIETKSLQQTSFTSTIWKSMVAYIKKPQASLRQVIIEASPSKEINLILLVSHQKEAFQNFVQNEAIQILFEFGIPVMIFQAGG